MKKLFLALFILSATKGFTQRTLFYNGNIITADSNYTQQQYFVVQGNVITETGTDLAAISQQTFDNKVDLQSRTVLPGLIDSHVHFIDGGLVLLQTSFAGVTDADGLSKRLLASKDQTVDNMFVGSDLGYEALQGMASPRTWLDEQAGDVAVIIFLKSGHGAIANTKALDWIHPTSNALEKDDSGKPSGYLWELAAMEASKIVNASYSVETIEKAILKAQALALSYGITTIGDNTFNPYFFKVYQALLKTSDLKMRIRSRSYGRIPQTEDLMKGLGHKHLGFIGTEVDASRVNYHAMKYFEDMSLSVPDQHARYMEPGGEVFLDREQLNRIFEAHPQSVFAFHVQGKKGLDNLLNVIEKRDSRQRHVLDHAGYASTQQVQRAGQRGLAMTLIGSQLFDYPRLNAFYQAADSMFVPADLLDAHTKYQLAHAALTSDYPFGMDTTFAAYPFIDGLNPFPNMAVNVTGRYPDGQFISGIKNKTLTLEEAIRAYTTHGAYVLGEEQMLGQIAPRFKADFVILQNNFTIEGLYDVKVAATYINGERVFESQPNTITTLGKYPRVRNSNFAISPVIGYDPVLGLILGGAYFQYPLKTPGSYFDVQLQSLTRGNTNWMANYTRYELWRHINLNVSAAYSNFFQYYFGEGNDTQADAYAKLFADTYRFRSELVYSWKHNLQWTAFATAMGRRETSAESSSLVPLGRVIPNENTYAAGWSLKHDTRDNAFSTKTGVLQQITIQHTPAAWNGLGNGSFTQLMADVKYFQRLLHTSVVLASHVGAGINFGNPGYLYRYSLGGAYALRGVYANRFRGDQYYVAQVELRFPIYKRLSGATFTDAGDVKDRSWSRPIVTYGGGIRLALTENIKLRLDYGQASDQSGVFFTFSEAF